jgi:3-phenylpropionate/trans-cinnamate dioxygenase ferredoxin reductase subunit
VNTVCIAGAGQAAIETVAALRAKGFEGRITLIGAEAERPYQRPPLSKQILTGKMEWSRVFLRSDAFYAENDIEFLPSTTVTGIDRAARSIVLDNGTELGYYKLLVATGARPYRLDLQGSELPGVMYLRSLQDSIKIRDELLPGRRIAVIGGGYIGLEVAASARTMGCEVTVFEMAPALMSRQADAAIAAWFEQRHRDEGVEIRCSSMVSAIEGAQKVEGIVADGDSMPFDLVITGVGVVPNVEWLEGTDLLEDGALWVDGQCRSRDANIFGAGDVTVQMRSNGSSMRLESVQNAVFQGRTAAAAMLGEAPPPFDVPWFWSEQYDMRLQIAGLPSVGDEQIVRRFENGISTVYLDQDRVSCVSVVSNPREFMAAKQLILKRCAVERDRIADPGVSLKDLIT